MIALVAVVSFLMAWAVLLAIPVTRRRFALPSLQGWCWILTEVPLRAITGRRKADQDRIYELERSELGLHRSESSPVYGGIVSYWTEGAAEVARLR